MAKALHQTWTIARRETAAGFHSLVAFVVMVLFLVVEGFSFWAVLQVLANPSAPAPYGAVLRTHFGGNFLYWTFLFFVVAILSMRLVAEEKRHGTWETLLTAPVGEGAVIVGKWLGAFAFYTALWAPTVAYVLVLRAFAPPGTGPDPGPLVCAYVGVLLSGAAFLAVGLAASAITSNQIVAAILAFVKLVGLFLLGLVPEIAPAFVTRHPTAGAFLDAVNVRRHLDDFARGIVDTRTIAFYVGLIVLGLVAATVVARGGRHRRERGSAALGLGLVAAAVVLGNVVVARHPLRLDFTARRVYSLDLKTLQILEDVRRPVEAVILAPEIDKLDELYDEVRELLRRFQAAQPRIEVEEIDPALDPGRIGALAERYGLSPEELAQGGAVVFSSGERARAVALLDMADFGTAEQGGRLESFRGEEEFAAAILEVTDEARPEVCLSTGHGETELATTKLVQALERDGARPSPLPELAGGVPARCVVLAVLGPRRGFTAGEALAVDAYLGTGGRLLLAVDAQTTPARDAFVPTGLETVLLQHGVRLGSAVVVDPEGEFGVPFAWQTLWGYGEHPISAAFQGRRNTVWLEPRWVEPRGPGATALVSSSTEGFGETNLATLTDRQTPDRGPRDLPGPLSVAVASAAPEGAKATWRVVVLGSARSFSDEVLQRGLGQNEALVASSLAWLTGRTKLLGVGAKTPEQFRVVMTADQVRRVFWLCVLGLPGLAALAGAVVHLRRRRGA